MPDDDSVDPSHGLDSPGVPFRHDDVRRQAAAARQAADEAAEANWSQSVSRAKAGTTSSAGSLYRVESRPADRSTLADWSLGLGLLGALLVLVHCVRNENVREVDALLGPVLLGAVVGAGVGAVTHWMVGFRARRAQRPPR